MGKDGAKEDGGIDIFFGVTEGDEFGDDIEGNLAIIFEGGGDEEEEEEEEGGGPDFDIIFHQGYEYEFVEDEVTKERVSVPHVPNDN